MRPWTGVITGVERRCYGRAWRRAVILRDMSARCADATAPAVERAAVLRDAAG